MPTSPTSSSSPGGRWWSRSTSGTASIRYTREQTRLILQRKLKFLDFAKFHFISAKRQRRTRSHVPFGRCRLCRGDDQACPRRVWRACWPMRWPSRRRRKHGMFRPKPRYAHQGGSNPPIIVVHGNAVDQIGDSYRRYLESTFREAFKLQGTPLRIQFVTAKSLCRQGQDVKTLASPRQYSVH
jgi:GTP-binding protein